MCTNYPSDVTDKQWPWIQRLLLNGSPQLAHGGPTRPAPMPGEALATCSTFATRANLVRAERLCTKRFACVAILRFKTGTNHPAGRPER